VQVCYNGIVECLYVPVIHRPVSVNQLGCIDLVVCARAN
jgi:hypothetical protein